MEENSDFNLKSCFLELSEITKRFDQRLNGCNETINDFISQSSETPIMPVFQIISKKSHVLNQLKQFEDDKINLKNEDSLSRDLSIATAIKLHNTLDNLETTFKDVDIKF